MAKRLTLLVGSCRECPYAVPPDYDSDAPYHCTEFGADVYNFDRLPPWCPLPDWDDATPRSKYKRIKPHDR